MEIKYVANTSLGNIWRVMPQNQALALKWHLLSCFRSLIWPDQDSSYCKKTRIFEHFSDQMWYLRTSRLAYGGVGVKCADVPVQSIDPGCGLSGKKKRTLFLWTELSGHDPSLLHKSPSPSSKKKRESGIKNCQVNGLIQVMVFPLFPHLFLQVCDMLARRWVQRCE